MFSNTYILIAAALFPAIILCVYVFIKDRVEKEPLTLLFKLLLFGVVICFPASYLENFLFRIIDSAFAGYLYSGSEKMINLYNAVKYFIGVALVEEGLKWGALIFITMRDNNFSHLFDGLIYAVFVSLGFAAFENVLYVLEYGIFNAISRGILSVPGHMFFAVMMGYYYSLWHMTDEAAKIEKEAINEGLVHTRKPFSSKRYIILSLLIPTLAHGFYDYCCVSESNLSLIMLLLFVFGMYLYCFGKINKMSRTDDSDDRIAMKMFIRKYPELFNR